MKALITGASSGIGYEMTKILCNKGFQVIGVARNEEKLNKLQEETGCEIYIADVSDIQSCINIHNKFNDIDMLINNAGFGDVGMFTETDLKKEISMIETNVTAVHILTKLYLKDMVSKNSGYILNVASIAAFMPGPLMATYYATKAYVLRLTRAVQYELKKQKSAVYIGVLCPGPVKTGFDDIAGVNFSLKGISAKKTAEYTISCMLKNKKIILPTFKIKVAKLMADILPERLTAAVAFKMQSKKIN